MQPQPGAPDYLTASSVGRLHSDFISSQWSAAANYRSLIPTGFQTSSGLFGASYGAFPTTTGAQSALHTKNFNLYNAAATYSSKCL
ncbi:unnamed protein product, partial [Mesorhabditis belari]